MVYIVCEMRDEEVDVVFMCKVMKFVMVDFFMNKVFLICFGICERLNSFV